ncbi:hypothetical protein [Buttiauxella brennerae]|uniref:hypothetical protein n=1 Tax=Buttiauxella brennerae TaxID=82988 RepID=UPI00286FAAAC|nr:hypothetical protein [Buttiauxella brennerae]
MITFILCILFIILILIFCFESPRRSYSPNEVIPYKWKLTINKYRRFIYSSGKTRQMLVTLVSISLLFLIINPFENLLLTNISYSLIAAFIFDTGINFNRENISKIRASKRWHARLYSTFDRKKVLENIINPSKTNVTDEEVADLLLASIFKLEKNNMLQKIIQEYGQVSRTPT